MPHERTSPTSTTVSTTAVAFDLRTAWHRLRALIGWLLVSAGAGQRTSAWWQIVLTAAGIMAVAMVWTGTTLSPLGVAPFPKSHAIIQFELRFNAYTCGKYPFLSSHERSLRHTLTSGAEMLDIPASRVVELTLGSRAPYCASLTIPHIRNENSLGLLYHAFLILNPDLTLNDAATYLKLVALTMLAATVVMMLILGLSPVMTLLAVVTALSLEEILWQSLQAYALYPLLLPTMMFYASAVILVVKLLGARRRILFLSALFAAGLVAGFYLNLRSSHAPLIAAGAALMALSLWWVTKSNSRKGTGAVRIVAATLLSGLVFLSGLWIVHRPLVDQGSANADTPGFSTHHGVMHPLVLGLALPPNPFSDREGIRWLDRIGLGLAQQADRDVTYLGPNYEKALRTYYIGLWKKHPQEMIGVYLLKWHTAGEEMLRFITESALPFSPLVQPLRLLHNGAVVPLAWLALLAIALWRRRSLDPAVVLALCITAVFGLLLFLESTIIHSSWIIRYRVPSVFLLVLTLLVSYQLVIDVTAKFMRARKIDSDAASDRTIKDFGTQWTTYDDTSGHFGSVELLADFIAPFPVERFKEAKVADIGAGTGRFSRTLLNVGAAHVTAVEPSEAVELIRGRVVPEFPNRIDVLNVPGDRLPATADLDFAISIGVLHHIPEPAPVVSAVYAALKPGGQFIAWLYGKEGNAAYLRLVGMIRPISTRLPPKLAAGLAWLLDSPLVAYIGLCRMLPNAGLPLTDYVNNVLAQLPGDKRRLVIYDQIKPRYAKYYTKQEALGLMRVAPFDVEVHSRRGFSWVVVGTKPGEGE